MARGNLLAFIDDDCVIAGNWLDSILSYMADHADVAAVGGAVKPLRCGGGRINRYLSLTKHLDGPIRINGEIANMASANLIIRRDKFEEIGGFDDRFPYAGAEDQNLLWRLAKIGKLGFSEEIAVLHNHDISFKDFCKKYKRYGQGVTIHNHLMHTAASNEKDDYYVPYCTKNIHLFTKAGKIYCRSKEYLERFDIKAPDSATRLLAFLQEFCFQLGSASIRRRL
ncbi:hypothetical protein FACS1894186_8150 [Alphaproteobacteria bacterium]|nr:hypothetical protein FACS1894186_8150 [Alphaproteobacteria bacterium]